MKDMIISKKAQERNRQLIERNADKIVVMKVGRILSLIDLDSKYIWAISNGDIHATRDLRSTNIKKHWKLTGQIQREVNGLHKD